MHFYSCVKVNIFTILLLNSSLAFGQNASDIIGLYFKAVGGKDRIDSVQTITAKTQSINFFANSSSKLFLKRNYKYRIEMSYEDGRHTVNCFNGSKHSGSNRIVAEMLEATSAKIQHIFIINELLFTPVSGLHKEPSEIINDIKCHVLSYHDVEWGSFYKYYFDVGTHLLLAEDYNLPSKSYSTRTIYKNYESIDGILFPMKYVMVNNGMDYTTEYTEIILNPELPDDIFECNPK